MQRRQFLAHGDAQLGVEVARDLAGQGIGATVVALLITGFVSARIGASGKRVWASLTQIDPEILASFLRNEYPQTVAVVLSKVRSDHAARVLTSLPEDFALECVQRMLRMEPVQREILDKIEATLRTEFMSNLARTSKRDSHEMMADIFNSFDRQTEARFIGALEERNRESAERIRALGHKAPIADAAGPNQAVVSMDASAKSAHDMVADLIDDLGRGSGARGAIAPGERQSRRRDLDPSHPVVLTELTGQLGYPLPRRRRVSLVADGGDSPTEKPPPPHYYDPPTTHAASGLAI